MSVIDSTTGHSRGKERNMARVLYGAIIAAILIGGFAAIMAGKSDRGLNPKATTDSVHQDAPDAGPAGVKEPIQQKNQ